MLQRTKLPSCGLRVSDVDETIYSISKIAPRGHANNTTNATKARLTKAATNAQQRIAAGENSRLSCEVSTQSGGIKLAPRSGLRDKPA